MLCLTPIYWSLGFSPKGVLGKSGLNSGQDQVAEPVNLCTVTGVDNGGRIDFLNNCRPCQDAAGAQAIAVIDGAFNITAAFSKIHRSDRFLRYSGVCVVPFQLTQARLGDFADCSESQIHKFDRLCRRTLAVSTIMLDMKLFKHTVNL